MQQSSHISQPRTSQSWRNCGLKAVIVDRIAMKCTSDYQCLRKKCLMQEKVMVKVVACGEMILRSPDFDQGQPVDYGFESPKYG